MRALPLLLIALLLWPAASTAAPMRHLVTVPGEIDAVAYAGSERLYATGHRLLRLGPGGRPVRVARLRGRAIQLVASPSAVALIEGQGRERRLLAGPPGGPLGELGRCRGARPEIPFSLLAAAGTTIAEALTCERARGIYNGAASLRLHDGATVRTVNAPPGTRAIALAGAPGLLAVATQAESLRGPVRVDVSDAATGAPRYGIGGLREPPFLEPLGLREDGLAAFCGPDGRLAWASPAEPTAHPIGPECPTTIALTGDAVAHLIVRTDALVVADLLGHARTLVRPAGDLPFAWDGVRALVRGVGCGADFLGEIEPSPTPYRGPSCRVRVVRVARRGGAMDVRVACRPGCRGDVQVLLGNGGDYDTAPLRIRRTGSRTVRVRLRDRARRLLARYRSVPFHVIVSFVNPADGVSFQRARDRSGALPGDGSGRFPPEPAPVLPH